MTFAAGPAHARQVTDLSFLLSHASHVLATRMTSAFAEIGITPREYCVLAHALGGEYTQIELAKLADLDKTTMLNTMDYLEREGSRAGFAARPEPAQHTEPHEHAQPVPGGGEVAEPQRGELAGGQHAVPSDEAGQLTVAVGQMSGHGQHRGLVPCC
jgi:MarR family transcriptional regulator, transcriptional regulator for hemolysin